MDDRGFTFFTNYESRKGRELAREPACRLVCFWAELQRQIRIEGTVERVTPEESGRYHRSLTCAQQLKGVLVPERGDPRPRRAGIAARNWKRNSAMPTCPRPPHWGGYRLFRTRLNSTGRPNRLHDRIRYRKAKGEGLRSGCRHRPAQDRINPQAASVTCTPIRIRNAAACMRVHLQPGSRPGR